MKMDQKIVYSIPCTHKLQTYAGGDYAGKLEFVEN